MPLQCSASCKATSDYLNPVLVCKPIPAPTGFIHTTRYQAWYEAQQVYYESTPAGVKLGWNTLILLRNSVENFCSHMAYGLRTHNRDHPDYRMTVVDLVRLVQLHPEDLDAPLAYALNCFQALNVCARTLRLYSIDHSYQWPEQEDLKGTTDEILDLLSKPAPAGAGLPHTIAVASYNQLRIESGLLADYSWMNQAFKMWNQAIEDMDQDIDRGLRPGHVYLIQVTRTFLAPLRLTLLGQGLRLELVTPTVLFLKDLRILSYNLLPTALRLQRRGLNKSRREAGQDLRSGQARPLPPPVNLKHRLPKADEIYPSTRQMLRSSCTISK